MILPTFIIPIPVAQSAGAQLILEEVSSVAAASRELVADRIAEGLEAIAANVLEKQQSLMTAGEGQAEAIRDIFANARDQVTQFVTNAQSQLQADAATRQAALEQGHAASLAQTEATFISRQERAQELGNTYSGRAIDTANEAAQQVQSQIQGYSQEARNIGQTKARTGGATPEISQTKAQVANELATDTATKITGGMSDAMAQLSSTGPPTADAIREQGQEAARQLGGGQAQVVGQLINTNQQATSAIQQTITAGNQALAGLETQLLEQLSTLENSLLNQLQTQIAEKNQEIDTTGQQAITAFQEQGQQAVAAGDNNLAELSAQIAGMNIEPTTAPEAAKNIVGQISGAYDSLIRTADNAFQQVDSGLSQTGTDVIGQIEALSGSVAGEASSFLTQAQSQVSQQSTTIGTLLADTVTHTTTSCNGMVDQVAGSLDGQLNQLDQSFAQGLGDYRNHLDGQVTSAANQAREPATTLPSRIDQAQSRAETRAQQGFWERQWNDFKEMVSDPGFWVGLIVGLILAVIVIALIVAGTLTGGLAIVAAFAVVGAIAAAVGSVVSQATNGSFSGGWEWSRVSGWEVLKAAGIGAAFGAALTVAVLWMGPALAESIAGIAIISGLTGVLTIVTNLVTGQPWDKGLLANMLFAGVLAWLGKYFRLPGRGRTGGGRGRGGVPAEGGGEGPVRPPVEEPVRPPGPEEPVNRPPRGGNCFVAGTLVHTENGPIPIEHIAIGVGVQALHVDGDLATSLAKATVRHCFKRTVTAVLDLRVGQDTITCTDEHPFWVPKLGWCKASTLTAGASLLGLTGKHLIVDSIAQRNGHFTVYNIEVDRPHDYFVGEAGILVHNKAMRWILQDRASVLKPSVDELIRQARALPEDAPNRAELVRQAEALEPEANRLSRLASEAGSEEALEPSRSAIESMEERLGTLEEAVENASLPSRARNLPFRVRQLMERIARLPNDSPGKYETLNRLREMEVEAEGLRQLAEAYPEQAGDLYNDITNLEYELRNIEEKLPGGTGPDQQNVPRPHLNHPANQLPTGGTHPYEPPRQAGNPEVVRHPEGGGYLDRYGNKWEWARDPHAGSHWDVQHPDRTHTNVYPDGEVHQGSDNF